MTNLIVLDVVIGLVFVYLLYSMLATILQELLATWFSFRSKLLERAISRMLEDGSVFDKRFGSLKALFKKINPSENATNITGLFYNHLPPGILSWGGHKTYRLAYLNSEWDQVS